MKKPSELGSDKPSLDLDLVGGELPVEDSPDSKTQKELENLDREVRRARIKGLQQDIDQRKTYANRVFWLLAAWLVGIACLLLFQGFLSPWGLFDLSSEVLLAAIGGTTVSVVGIFLVVVRYLFRQR